jgi:hypothetical protein
LRRDGPAFDGFQVGENLTDGAGLSTFHAYLTQHAGLRVAAALTRGHVGLPAVGVDSVAQQGGAALAAGLLESGRRRKKALSGQRKPFRVSSAALWSGRTAMVLLRRRGRREPFTSLSGFRFRLRLGRLLDFFPAFVFASHVCKCATTGGMGGRPDGKNDRRLFLNPAPGPQSGRGSGPQSRADSSGSIEIPGQISGHGP